MDAEAEAEPEAEAEAEVRGSANIAKGEQSFRTLRTLCLHTHRRTLEERPCAGEYLCARRVQRTNSRLHTTHATNTATATATATAAAAAMAAAAKQK